MSAPLVGLGGAAPPDDDRGAGTGAEEATQTTAASAPAPVAPASEPAPSGATSPGNREAPMRSALAVIGTIGPPLTIVTSLMIYFGWARSDRQARAMGLDVSLFGFSTQDYVMLSISTLFVPLIVVAVVGLCGLALHHRVVQALRDGAARRRLHVAGRVTLWIGLVAAVLGLVAAIRPPGGAWTPLLTPIGLALATAVAAYGAWLADAARDPAAQGASWTPSQRALRTLLLGSLITLALFWATSSYAAIVGTGYAERLAESVASRPRVTAFSAVPLAIEAPGVLEEQTSVDEGEEGAIRYRTTGLRLLTRSGGRMFLLHDGWTVADGTVIVLPDDETVRWQFSR